MSSCLGLIGPTWLVAMLLPGEHDLNTSLMLCRKAAEQHDNVFKADKVHNLIVRLRHNVIRAGLRRISLAYSRISLADVATKLGLANVEDTECIVAKAIRFAAIIAAMR